MKSFPVVIVGGGPSGSTLAHFLKEKGIESLIIEKANHFRYKVCAGGIPVSIFKWLPDNLSYFEKTEYDTLLLDYKGEQVTSSIKLPFSYGVERTEFDEYLRSGLNVHYNESFLNYNEEKDYIIVKTDKASYKCSFLIGADGVGSRVSIVSGIGRKRKFVIAEEKEAPLRVDDKNIAKIYLGYNFLGYGWRWAKQNSYSIGIGALQKYFKRGTIQKIDETEYKVKTFPIALWDGFQKLTKGRVALVGEAAALVDPFTAAGILYAIQSSRILSEVIYENLKIKNSNLEKYNDLLQEAIYSEFTYAITLSKVFYIFLPIIKNILLRESTLNYVVNMAHKGYISYKEILQRIQNSKRVNLQFLAAIIKLISR